MNKEFLSKVEDTVDTVRHLVLVLLWHPIYLNLSLKYQGFEVQQELLANSCPPVSDEHFH